MTKATIDKTPKKSGLQKSAISPSAGTDLIPQEDKAALARQTADALLHPADLTGILVGDILNVKVEDDVDLLGALTARIAKVRAGDLSDMEAVLVGQVMTLNTLFTDMTMRAVKNRNQFPETCDRFMRLALKAQAQCRVTVEAIAEIKNPPVVFARHANVASGPQQINHYGAEDARGEKAKPGELPHAHVAALPRPDPLGNGVPIPIDAERALPDARREVAGRIQG